MEIEQLNEIRRQRGMQIAMTSRIMKREKGGYVVPSQSGDGAYIVKYDGMIMPECECPDYEKRGILGVFCKHIWAVECMVEKQTKNGKTTITKTVKVTYPQDWSAYNQAQTSETVTFMSLLHDMTKNVSQPYVFGRPSLNLGEVVFCSAMKVYSTLSSRRTMMNYKTAFENGYISKIPHFNAVSKLLNKKELSDILLRLITVSSMPLKSVETSFAVDSTGFSTCRFDRWYNFKYGRDVNSRIWLKAHAVCGTKTNIITAVKITDAHSHDSKEFAGLVGKTAENFTINELSGDKAYNSRDNLELIGSIKATPYIPFRDNSTGRARGSTVWKKMYHYFMFNREEFLQHYHKRSNIETTFNMIKAKFGSSVRSKNMTAQVNEILLKILCHNLCCVIQEMHELDISPDFCTQSQNPAPKVDDD
ncbi:IS4/IS5 family transposase [archaeon]|nr:MAG: IS4/IS5 family transposase [archaeon]